MKKILIALSCLLASVNSLMGSPVAESSSAVMLTLKPRQPNWRYEIIKTHPQGSPEKIVFYEPTAQGVDRPVKQIFFYDNNQIQYEMDLGVVEDDSAAAKEWGSTAVPHGTQVDFSRNGELIKISRYHFGFLDGEAKSFYPNGKVKNCVFYQEGFLQGPAQSYYEDGQIKESASFVKGVLEGEVIQYHENGNKSALLPYKNGALHGTVFNWFPSGLLLQKRQFFQGALHGDGKNPALISYDEQRNVIEVLDFREGKPVGLHTRYHKNGKEAYRVPFRDGLKNGKEQFFSDVGTLLGEGQYENGHPIGKHWRNHSNEVLASVALFDAKGTLLEPILEYDEKGQLTRQFSLEKERLNGSYYEWYSDGTSKIEYNYILGEFDGAQKEYYPSGQLKISTHYKNGKHDGLHEEWHENGILSKRIHFSEGLRDGQMGEWYPNGNAKLDAYFLADCPDGIQTEWHENGQLKVRAEFAAGKKEGWQREWRENGDPLYEAFFEQDLPTGMLLTWWNKDQIRTRFRYEKGLKQGKHEWFYENGHLERSASFKNDLMHGEMFSWFPDGSIQSHQLFSKGKPTGEHTTYYAKTDSGQKDEERLSHIFRYDEEGNLHGEEKTFYPDGKLQAMIVYEHGLINGVKELRDPQGRVIEEATYIKGKLEGKFFQITQDGREVVTYYHNNLKNGPHFIYFPPNEKGEKVKAVETLFENDQVEGYVTEYDQKGVKIAETPYVHGQKNGIAQVYSPDGKLTAKICFRDDKKEGLATQYFPNGSIFRETFYSKDRREGEERTYHEMDSEPNRLASICVYSEDRLNGLSQSWNREGILVFEGEFQDDLRHGKFNKYYDNGKPYLEQTYAYDKLEGEKKKYDLEGKMTVSNYEAGQLIDVR